MTFKTSQAVEPGPEKAHLAPDGAAHTCPWPGCLEGHSWRGHETGLSFRWGHAGGWRSLEGSSSPRQAVGAFPLALGYLLARLPFPLVRSLVAACFAAFSSCSFSLVLFSAVLCSEGLPGVEERKRE